MKIYRSAIIGLGCIHMNHVNAIKECPNAELVAICDIDEELLNRKKEELGCAGYTDYIDMLEQEEIDVVHICTPHYLHAEMAINCMLMGKHVLTEKPMGMNSEETEGMIQAAEDTGLQLGICFQNRYNATSRRVRELLDSGRMGAIKGSKMIVTWDRDEKYYGQAAWRGTWKYEGGGVLINQAIHTLDLMQWFTGYPTDVQAQMSCYRLNDCIEVEDTAHGYFHFPGGATGIFYATNNHCASTPIELEIICENGVISLKDTLTVQYSDGTVEHCDDSSLATGEKAYWGTGHVMLIRDYYEKLDSDEDFPIGGREACKAIRMIEAIYQSAATGNKIRI